MKRIACILLALICLFSLFACSKYDEDYVYDGKSLIGKWCESDIDESYRTYEFFDNGKVELCEYSYGIKTSAIMAEYTASNSEIVTTITNYNGTKEYIHQKFSISDGNLVFVYINEDDHMTETELVLVPFKDKYISVDKELIGSWQDTENENEVWTFKDDRTGTISDKENSYKIHYSVDGNKLYMAYEFVDGALQNFTEYKYKIKNDTLTIVCKVDNQSVKLTLERK